MQTFDETFTVQLAGDSIWSDTQGKTVTVSRIIVETFEHDANDYMQDYKSVYVEHDATWEIYTDTGFERAISERLGFAVTFTEQGMQEDGFASLEN